MEAHSGAPQALCSFLLLCLVSFQIYNVLSGIIEKDDGSMEEEIGELRRSHPKIWRGETLHSAMPSTSVRKALRTLLRIRWLSASRQRKWLLGTSSREPTTTFVTSVCGSPSYGAWEFLYVTVSCCLSGETGLIFHSSDDINSSRMH